MKPHRALASLTAVALMLAQAGCISLFPKVPPAQLYEFGTNFPVAHMPQPGAPRFGVLRSSISFPPAAGGDRILTTDGQSAAYIAGSRWVSPAQLLFDAAQTRAFDADGGPARLIRPGEVAGAVAELRLDVERFEVSYPGNLKAAPTVVVEVNAILIDLHDRHVIADKTFTSSKPTSDNRVGEIVQAFDAATVEVLGGIAAWTDAEGASLPPAA